MHIIITTSAVILIVFSAKFFQAIFFEKKNRSYAFKQNKYALTKRQSYLSCREQISYKSNINKQ
jgi:hypothetical protein